MPFTRTFRSVTSRRRRAAALTERARRLALESLERRLALAVTMTIDPTALGLGPNYGVWVSGTANANSTDAATPFKWLDHTNQFVKPTSPSAGTAIPLLPITSQTTITFDGTDDLSGRLTIYVSAIATPPTAPTLIGSAPGWGVAPMPTSPYLSQQTITDYGTVTPYDIVEFTYLHASDKKSTFDTSGVDGFGIPLTLSSTATGTSVGPQTTSGYSRAAIGDAFTKFMNAEKYPTADPQGANFVQLMYGPGRASPFIAPPTVPANQFFSISNPWYWIKNQHNTSSATPANLLSYWDTTLDKFFTVGNKLSINLSAGANAPDIWEGSCSLVAGVPTYRLTQVGTGAKATFAKPAAGYKSVEYVFGNKFPASQSTAGDAGLLQDNIWESLNRGVALDGVLNAKNPAAAATSIKASPAGAVQNAQFDVTITTKSPHGLQAGDTISVSGVKAAGNQFFDGYNGLFTVKSATSTTFTYFIAPKAGSQNPVPMSASGGGTVRRVGQTTQAWNANALNTSAGRQTWQWYKQHASPAFPGFNSAYNTYAKFLHYSTLDGTDSRNGGTPIFINNQAYAFAMDETPNGPYSGPTVPSKFDGTITQGSSLTLRIGPWGTSANASIAVVSGDFDGNGLTDIADLKATGQWQVGLTPTSGSPTTVNAGSPWSTSPTWNDFTVVRDTATSRDVVIARASDTVDGSWWKLSLDGTTWNTTFVGSWGIPDQWVDVVPGDFDGNGKQDIAGRWRETGEWWMLSDAAAAATTENYAAKNVKIGQWNPATAWSKVVAGNFTGDANGKDTIAGLTGPTWWLLEYTGGSSTNTAMTSAWSTAHNWVDYQVGNFTGAANGQEQIAARSASSGAWHLLGKSGSSYAISSMAAWNPAASWLTVVTGDFDGNGTADIAGRNAATGAWTVLQKSGSGFVNAAFGGAWTTSSSWGQAFAGIYNQQSQTPKKFGILGRSSTGGWIRSLSNGAAFTSASVTGYPT